MCGIGVQLELGSFIQTRSFSSQGLGDYGFSSIFQRCRIEKKIFR